MLLTVSIVGVDAQVEAWNRLIPLESTPSEVENILGKPEKYFPTYGLYETKIGRFTAWFAGGKCLRNRDGEQYKVRPNLLIGLRFLPKSNKALSEYVKNQNFLIRWPDLKKNRVFYFTQDGVVAYDVNRKDDGNETVLFRRS